VPAVVVSLALLSSFGLWVTLHCALLLRLWRRSDKRWALLWLFLPPASWLAPYWGFQHRSRALSVAWIATLAAYVTLLVVGSRWPV
jgi:hypothetical protein